MQTKANDSLENKLTAVFGSELTRQMSSLPKSNLSTESAIKFFGLGEKEDCDELAEKAIESAKSFQVFGLFVETLKKMRSLKQRGNTIFSV